MFSWESVNDSPNISFQMCTVHQTATTRPVVQPVLRPVNIKPLSVSRSAFRAASVTLVSSRVKLAACVHRSVAAQTPEVNTTASTQPSGARTTVVSAVPADLLLERSTATQPSAPEEWSAGSSTTIGCVNLKTPRTVPSSLGCISPPSMDIILTSETVVHILWFKPRPT